MARGFLRDSGGTPRQARRPFLRDGAGVPRLAKRIFERDANGIPRLVYRVLFSGSIIAGEIVTQSPVSEAFGYGLNLMGSISPSGTLSDGKTIEGLDVVSNDNGPFNLNLVISGFASQPPQSYFESLIVSGLSFSSASAGFSYLNGSANWGWPNVGIVFGVGSSYSVLIA